MANDTKSLPRLRRGRMLEDLTSIEVKTLVTENISGSTMADPRLALHEIGEVYGNTLATIAQHHDVTSDGLAHVRQGSHPGSRDTFDAQRTTAEQLSERLTDTLTVHEAAKLDRIRSSCEELSQLFDRIGRHPSCQGAENEKHRCNAYTKTELLGVDSGESTGNPEALPLSPSDRLALQRIWSLGMDPIAIRTVVQMDGDIVTRIRPEWAEGSHAALHALHLDGIRTAIDTWQDLLRAVAEFAGELVSGLWNNSDR